MDAETCIGVMALFGIPLLIIFGPILVIWSFNLILFHPFGVHLETNLWTWIATWIFIGATRGYQFAWGD